jgi:regulator of replication initiation timing
MKNLIIIALSIICIFFIFKGCARKNMIEELSDKVELLEFTSEGLNTQIREKITENGELIAKTDVLLIENDQLKDKIKNKDLKNIQSSVKFIAKTIHDTIVMYRKDTILIHDGVKIKAEYFEKVDKWITLKGFLDSNKVHIDTLAIVNDFDVQLGQEKDGWFKKKNVVIIQSKNPHTKIDSIKPYVFPEKKKWYQRDGWKIIGTALLTSYLFIR